MTRNDLLNGNVDLIAHAATFLAGRPKQTLQIAPVGGLPVTQVQVTATNLDRVDLHVDERPVASVNIAASPTVMALPKPIAAARVVARGYRGAALVASAGVTIP